MTVSLTRRQVLIGGIGAAGVLAAAGGLRTEAGEPAASARPDRSQQAPAAPVAIQRCESYDPHVVRAQLDAALRLIGGIGDLVRNKTVTVKLNLTGGSAPACGLSAIRTYHTHQAVVAALCATLADEGAKQVYLVESFYFREPCEQALKAAGWDVDGIKAAGDQRVAFENTRNRGAWPAYSRLKVPWGGFVFPSLDVNQRYEKTDVFISVAKLKNHGAAGVTAAVKNLFGMPPQALYGSDAPDENSLKARMPFHEGKPREVPGLPPATVGPLPAEEPAWKFTVPRIVADCLGARPVDLAIVDAVETVIGGEGPWLKLRPTSPKLLLAGRNAVCTDAVCAAVMGYDPQAGHMQFPFPGENHLKLLASVGVGTNDLKRIPVKGLPIDQARHPFLAPGEKIASAKWPYYGVHIA